MKQIFKRIIAGTSAVILSLSAVGTDAFTNMFAGIVSAEDTNRKGKSTGFTNLEQDTSGEYYNTGYGLHTNKTATALADGRTFDVNLESWYVGENPVDVATILDASGSMAWTVDTLDPMKVSEQLTDEEIETLKSKYGTDDLTAIQNANGGYLPQDVVDLILDPKNTDNTKLEYDGYKYYVYEGRSTVSEFVPLGYWDGGTDPKTDPALIGYYPFSGDLKNKAPNAEKDATGILINHPDSGGVYDPNTPATKKIEGVFGTGEKTVNKETVTYIKGLNIADSASKGAIQVASPSTEKFSISFDLSVDNSNKTDSDNNEYGEATILYITDGTNSYRLYRGGGGSAARLKISTSNNKNPLNANAAVNTEPKNWIFTFDFSGGNKTLYIKTDTKKVKLDNEHEISEYTVNLADDNCPTLDTSKLQIYIGGNTTEPTKKVNDIYIRNLSISEYQTETVAAAESVALPEIFEPETVPATEEVTESETAPETEEVTEPETAPATEEVTEPETVPETEEITEPETVAEPEGVIELETIAGPEPLVIAAEEKEVVIAKYPLQTEENGLKNTVNGENPPVFVEQAYKNGGTFGTESIEYLPLDPVIKENKYLDVKATSEKGAVSIDAVPELDDGFTISMKLQRTASLKNYRQHIFYLGDENTGGDKKYYQFFRSKTAGGYLALFKGKQADFNDKIPTDENAVYYQGGVANNDWYTNTLVFEINPENANQYIVTPYINGEKKYQDGSKNNFTIDKITVNKENLVLLLGAIQKNDSGSELYLDDLYVFDKALSGDKVSLYFGDNTISCDADGTTHAVSYIKDDKGNFEKNEDGTFKTIEIAQISNGEKRLGKNTNIDQRRGWYYVNSNSNWKDIEGCLASGKEYIGIFTDIGIDDYPDMVKDTATEPNGYKYEDKGEILKQIAAGNNEHADYKPPTTERSIRFYVDSQNHLRCFVWSGNDSKKEDDKRTFCSLVYEKQDEQKTKYEELNNALNTFYGNLAEKSDLTNSAVVRFSTDKLLAENPDENLKRLIMKDWTNWADIYKSGETDKTTYFQDLLIPEEGEDAAYTTESLTRGDEIQEYPYVMTGGTYTWTGLKAFYDNMVKKDDLESGDRVYDVANDARDKYLIIFTDGRDNTQDYDVSTLESTEEGKKLAGSPDYENAESSSTFKGTKYVNDYNPYKDDEDEKDHKVGFSIQNYDDYKGEKTDEFYKEWQVQEFKTGDHEIATDGDLAQAWADKLKDEGYTIYCVMLATGSISEYTNKAEYDKAYNFLKSLAGSNEIDEEIAERKKNIDYDDKPDGIADKQKEIEALRDNYVMVVDPSKGGASSLEDAFEEILEQIQQPRNDYIVQDYIDPRFDLIGKAYTRNEGKYEPIDVIYHLGAGGEITFTDTNNKPIESENGYIYFDNGGYKTSYEISKLKVTVGNRIDNIDKTDIVRFAYTPITTENISGTGYIYYDDVKDMYYLRWENQVIPMTDKSFDTASEPDRHLNVWSATIRLKAKDDFIGGNNILTNGNEAGENLVYSDATIDNMDKNSELYGLEEGSTYREKLEVLSGANRKINAVDAGGVSQAIYGDGIDIPSSGFPRTTVNVKLLPLNAKNLNDVIYMGEVISPTMMLADLENDYMTGSYYLEYLERYAYRLYGGDAGETPLIELLNQWLKIDEEDETAKTFTIPYIYLPDPEYDENGKLVTEGEKVKIQNSTGATFDTSGSVDFTDLNLRDVTGFITYTWKRDDDGEEQQKIGTDSEGKDIYDITKEYIVKNTNQIKYNLQLTFTPLKEGDLTDFKLDNNFIEGEKFFNIQENEFNDEDVSEWTFTNRADYLKAMVYEKKNYTLYANYVEGKLTSLPTPEVHTNENVYNWDTSYKPVAGNVQIENDLTKYTNTLNNVGFADKNGNTITDKTGAFIEGKSAKDVYSLVANTTYIKDVVNGALALELVVKGQYLGEGSEINLDNGTKKTFQLIAQRYYDDPLDPLPYGGKRMDADVELLRYYQLTFEVDAGSIPKNPQDDQLYTVWAKLTKVEIGDSRLGGFKSIKEYGYAVEDALPIGTYTITAAETSSADNCWNNEQFKIADSTTTGANALYFQYLKTDNTPASYTYNRFPDSVYNVSKTAPESTGDRDYLIKDGAKDNSKKNIAESSRYADLGNYNNQKITFYFGTVERESGGNEGKKGKTDPENNYTKDRLGIILLSADSNSLAISKTVTYTEEDKYLNREWEFNITFNVDDTSGNKNAFESKNSSGGFELKWYKLDDDGKWVDESRSHDRTIKFTLVEDGDYSVLVGDDYIHYYKYTATLKLKHNEKVLISNLPEGTWQVTETDETSEIFYSAHNNMDDVDEYRFSNKTSENIVMNPNSHVDFINEFPHALPSAGGTGGTDIDITLYCSIMLVVAAALYFTKLFSKKCKISDEQKS